MYSILSAFALSMLLHTLATQLEKTLAVIITFIYKLIVKQSLNI